MSILLDIGEDLKNKSDWNALSCDNVKFNQEDTYILVKENEIYIIDILDDDKVEYFKNRYKYCYNDVPNRALCQSRDFKMKNMSLNPLGIMFNTKKIIEWNRGVKWRNFLGLAIEYTFRPILAVVEGEEIEGVVIELKNKFELYIKNNIEKLDKIISDADNVRIVPDFDEEDFKLLNQIYYFDMNKIFATVKGIKRIGEEKYGFNKHINLNNKMHFLQSKIYSNIKEATILNKVKPKKNMKDLGYKQYSFKQGQTTNYYWEYDSKEPENIIKKNNYIGKNKLKDTGKASIWQLGQYYIDKDDKNILYENLFNSKTITFNKYKKIENIVIKKMVKDLRVEKDKSKVINNLNIIFSVKESYLSY